MPVMASPYQFLNNYVLLRNRAREGSERINVTPVQPSVSPT